MSLSYLHLVGSTFCNGQAFLKYLMARGRELRPSDLQLVRDKNNPYDPNAVQVWYESEVYMEQLGFVQAELAPEIAHCMDYGGTVQVTDCSVYGSADTNFGVYFTASVQYNDNPEAIKAHREPVARDFKEVYAEFIREKRRIHSFK